MSDIPRNLQTHLENGWLVHGGPSVMSLPQLPHLPPGPIVLARSPEGSPVTETLPSYGAPGTTAIPASNPPSYEFARVPTETISYSFSPATFNSMLLLPPTTAQDTRPAYNIFIGLNCFNPLSSITYVRRGGTEDGEFVAEFELGISTKPGHVFMRRDERPISTVLVKHGSKNGGEWVWEPSKPSRKIVWDTRGFPARCYRVDQRTHRAITLARFSRSDTQRERGVPAVLSQLEVLPQGQEHLDDILVAILIIERKRLTPGSRESHDVRTLFS